MKRVFIFLLLVLLSSFTWLQADSLNDIEPGMDSEDVLSKLGDPSQTENLRGDHLLHYFSQAGVNSQFNVEISGTRNTVIYVSANDCDSRVKTDLGISMGAVPDEVIAAYGQPCDTEECSIDEQDAYYYLYKTTSNYGIGWQNLYFIFTASDNKLRGICIDSPQDSL